MVIKILLVIPIINVTGERSWLGKSLSMQNYTSARPHHLMTLHIHALLLMCSSQASNIATE